MTLAKKSLNIMQGFKTAILLKVKNCHFLITNITGNVCQTCFASFLALNQTGSEENCQCSMACQQQGLSWALLQWAELYWEREPDLLGSRVIFHFSYWENFFPLDSVVLWCRWESIGAIFRVTCIFLSFLIPIHITVGLLNTIYFRYPMLSLIIKNRL